MNWWLFYPVDSWDELSATTEPNINTKPEIQIKLSLQTSVSHKRLTKDVCISDVCYLDTKARLNNEQAVIGLAGFVISLYSVCSESLCARVVTDI